MKMALQFDIHIAASKQSNQLLDLLAGFFDAAMLQGNRQRSVCAAVRQTRPCACSSNSSL